jgi:hypothetical protein
MRRITALQVARRIETLSAAAAIALGSLLLASPGTALAQNDQKFVLPAGCTVPFPAKHQAIDDTCGIKGDSPDSQGNHQQQNEVKNNLCATGTPATETFADLASLQTRVDATGLKYDRVNLPDRKVLTDLGEGKVVRLVAFVASATYSNSKPRKDGSAGESVNCDRPGDATNDIHVVLVEARGNAVCSSVTAEVIPHMRPANWTPKALTATKQPVRITGQRFFDASHHPCKGGSATDGPARISEWEIHPVYKLEVCTAKTATLCTADDDTVWAPLPAAKPSAAHKKGHKGHKAPAPAQP